MMKKAEVAEFILRAREKGVPLGEINQFLLARSAKADGIRTPRGLSRGGKA
jgi:DNA-binding transcriptional MerR regulator